MLRLSSVYLAVSQCDKKWRASLIDTPVFAFAGGRKARQSKAKWGQKFYQSNIFCSFESWDVSWVNWKFINIPLWILGEIKWNQLSQDLSCITLQISHGICQKLCRLFQTIRILLLYMMFSFTPSPRVTRIHVTQFPLAR